MQQPIEPRQSIGSDQAELAVDDRRSHGQALEVLDHAGQALGVFGATLSVEAYSIAIHRHLEIDRHSRFMQPVRSARWAHGAGGDVRTDKVGRTRKPASPEYICGQPPAARGQNLDRKTSRWPDGSADCSPALFVAWWAKRGLKPCRLVLPKHVGGSGVKPYGSVGTATREEGLAWDRSNR